MSTVDLDTVQRLLEEVGQQDGLRLKVLHNAVVQTMREYRDGPTKATLANWKAAEGELAAEIERLQAGLRSGSGAAWAEFADTRNKAEVLRFLQRMGFAVSERTFYRHCDEGKCKKNGRGLYSRRLVKAYAEGSLHLAGAGAGADAPSEENLLAERLREQVRRERINTERDQIRLRRELGAVVERDSLNLEVAARAVALDAGFRQLVNSQAPEWVVTAAGNTEKVPELIGLILRQWDELVNTYAQGDEFEVLFEDAEDRGQMTEDRE